VEEQVFDFQARIESHENDLNIKRAAYQVLGERLAELETNVRRTALEYMHSNPEAKKMSIDKIELVSAATQEQKADYYELVGLRIREKIADKMIESIHGSMSSVQSLMSYWRSTQFAITNKGKI